MPLATTFTSGNTETQQPTTLVFHTLLVTGAVAEQLCADSSGVFLGLAFDPNAYDSVAGSALSADPDQDPTAPAHRWGPPRPSPPQEWKLTYGKPDGPANSYTGKYLQVLPDQSRQYPQVRHNSWYVMESVSELENDSPYVSFRLKVDKKGAGMHTLFVRWTAGDTYGGGDSFYAVMKNKNGSRVTAGQPTLKPVVESIAEELGKYVGCCSNHVTHACTCFRDLPTAEECPARVDNTTRRGWMEVDRASEYGVQCVEGAGKMEFVKAPEWYLFAGQDDGNVMDFDSEPWDASCEAEGSNTKDSGRDFPTWDLPKGEYELRIYAREDGTALDGIYVAGPGGPSPGVTRRYKLGDSTTCSRYNAGSIRSKALYALSFTILCACVAFLFITETGQEFKYELSMRVCNLCSLFRGNKRQSVAPAGYELQLDVE